MKAAYLTALGLSLSLAAMAGAAQPALPPRGITVDASAVKGPLNREFRFSVGSDRAIIHLRPEHQRDLRFLKDTCGFEYMRFHGLLNEEMHLVTSDSAGNLTYDWTNVDKVYDFLVKDLGIRPIVELGFMPEALASGKQTIFWWKGNVTPPKSYEQWGTFIEALTRHLTQRYGSDEVRRWYFEVWNEPNLDGFWTGGKDGYFQLYAASVRAIKRVDAAYRVGGPSTAGFAWVKDTLDFCAKQNLPIDFISTHAYGAKEGFLDIKGTAHTMLADGNLSVVDGLPRLLADIHASTFPKLPLLITEWGPSYSPRDPVHDSYFCAAWLLHRLRRVPDGVLAMSYWTFSDQFEEPGLPNAPFHGGFGLLTMQGLPKPAYFAYRYLNELGDTELACPDPDAYACRDGHGGVQVLLWDYHQPKQDGPNATFFARDLPAKPLGSVQLAISHLTPGTHSLTLDRVGYRHRDTYTAYLGLGSPPGRPDKPYLLTDGDLATLRAVADEKPEIRQVSVVAGAPLQLELPMNENDVYLVVVDPVAVDP